MTGAAIDRLEDPDQVGPFHIVGTLGTGGMGTVYLGERTEPFQQQVAIKIFHTALAGGDSAVAAGSEEQLLQSLDHANIVRLLDLGVSAQGRRYLVMEYVDGVAIDLFCDQRQLPVRQRIGLLLQVMDAVDYAHRHLVLHSDLKPANILVTPEGRVKLLDFGVATTLQEKHSAEETAQPGYTASFASPEQHAGERLTIASDVYALGVLASLLLTGAVPDKPTVSAGTIGSVISPVRTLRHRDMQALSKIAENRSTNPDRLTAVLKGDLDAILQKALRFDPADRFFSVEEFSSDLRRYLEGRPIAAKPVDSMDRAFKWVLRHRLAGALGLVLLFVLGLSTLGVVWQTAHAARQRRVAETRLHDLVRMTGTLEGELYDSVDPLAHSEAAKNYLLRGATDTLDQLAADDSKDTVLSLELAQQYAKLARLRMAEQRRGGADAVTRREALDDVAKALALVGKVRPSDAQFAAAQKQKAELSALKQQISST